VIDIGEADYSNSNENKVLEKVGTPLFMAPEIKISEEK
jgi:hypothetical protein